MSAPQQPGLVDSLELVTRMMRFHLLHMSPWGAQALEILENSVSRIKAGERCEKCGSSLVDISKPDYKARLCPYCDLDKLEDLEDRAGILEDDLPY